MKRSTRLVVTGASGFLGRGLVAYLAQQGHDVLALSRSPMVFDHPGVTVGAMPDLADPRAAWDGLLQSDDIVVHLAGLAHGSLDDERHEPINCQGTARLAEAAARAPVAQLIFVSSIAAQTGPAAGHVLTEADDPAPANAYGRAKLAAERAVASSGVAYTILRPGVVYGEDAKGNLRLLERLAQLPVPLPLAGVSARSRAVESRIDGAGSQKRVDADRGAVCDQRGSSAGHRMAPARPGTAVSHATSRRHRSIVSAACFC
jgi:nucleoside-diphosphate-sugar epimerase